MKKIFLAIIFLLTSIFIFGREDENVVYFHDVSTGEKIDKGVEELTAEAKQEVLRKIDRYNELKNKQQLTGKETEEMIELKDYIVSVYQRTIISDELELRRNTALAEQEVLDNLGKSLTAEEIDAIQKENESKKESETFMDSVIKNIFN